MRPTSSPGAGYQARRRPRVQADGRPRQRRLRRGRGDRGLWGGGYRRVAGVSIKPAPNARHLLAGSHGFFSAAEALINAPGIFHAPAFYVNLGFAIELSLKGYILARGGTDRELHDLGHDLLAAFKKAVTDGYQPPFDHVRVAVEKLSPIHKNHSIRYLLGGDVTVPDAHGTLNIVRVHLASIISQALALTPPRL